MAYPLGATGPNPLQRALRPKPPDQTVTPGQPTAPQYPAPGAPGGGGGGGTSPAPAPGGGAAPGGGGSKPVGTPASYTGGTAGANFSSGSASLTGNAPGFQAPAAASTTSRVTASPDPYLTQYNSNYAQRLGELRSESPYAMDPVRTQHLADLANQGVYGAAAGAGAAGAQSAAQRGMGAAGAALAQRRATENAQRAAAGVQAKTFEDEQARADAINEQRRAQLNAFTLGGLGGYSAQAGNTLDQLRVGQGQQQLDQSYQLGLGSQDLQRQALQNQNSGQSFNQLLALLQLGADPSQVAQYGGVFPGTSGNASTTSASLPSGVVMGPGSYYGGQMTPYNLLQRALG